MIYLYTFLNRENTPETHLKINELQKKLKGLVKNLKGIGKGRGLLKTYEFRKNNGIMDIMSGEEYFNGAFGEDRKRRDKEPKIIISLSGFGDTEFYCNLDKELKKLRKEYP